MFVIPAVSLCLHTPKILTSLGRNNHESDGVLFPQRELYSHELYSQIYIYIYITHIYVVELDLELPLSSC